MKAEEYLETKTLTLSKDMMSGYTIPYSYLVSMLNEFAELSKEETVDCECGHTVPLQFAKMDDDANWTCMPCFLDAILSGDIKLKN